VIGSVATNGALSACFADVDVGAAELDAFEEGLWGEKYPAVTASWRRRWGRGHSCCH
jgi:hypothetical protein